MALTRRAKIRFIAIVGLVGYAIVRFLLVQATFWAYGVNPWLFLAIDCGTAITYVIGVEQLVRGCLRPQVVAWWRLGLWGLLAGVSFALPYAYIFMASNKMPPLIGIGLVVVVILLAANVVTGIVKRIRKESGR